MMLKFPKQRKVRVLEIFNIRCNFTPFRRYNCTYIVPNFLVTRATDPQYANSENRFDMTQLFPDEWSDIVDGVKNGTLFFSEIKRMLRPDRQSDAAKKDKNSPYHQIRRRYEDNPKVVPNRVLAAETMAEYFMRKFSGGFDVNIFDTHYANVTLINYINYRNQG